MASYRLEGRRSATKDLRRIAAVDVPRIVTAAESLADDPFPPGCTKLSGSERSYRIRVGDYRILYDVIPPNEFRAPTEYVALGGRPPYSASFIMRYGMGTQFHLDGGGKGHVNVVSKLGFSRTNGMNVAILYWPADMGLDTPDWRKVRLQVGEVERPSKAEPDTGAGKPRTPLSGSHPNEGG